MSNEWLVRWFGEYVWDLRILSRRFDYAHQDADLSLLAPDWRDALCDRHALWPFDLMGVRASGYPGVFDQPRSAEYCTWEKFVTTVIGCLRRSTISDLSSWERQWQSFAADVVVSDPRYIAFRAVHDWVVLTARILGTEALGSEEGVQNDPASREDPFAVELPADPPDEPIGLIAGDPLVHMHARGFPMRPTPDSISPEWREVQDPEDALTSFHHRGAFYGFARLSLERLLRAELMTPAGFLSHNEHVLKDIPQWHERPEDVIEKDPRYIAYRSGWDRLIITHLGFWRTFVQARTGPPKVSRYTSKIDIDEFGNLYDTIEDSGGEVSGLEFCEPDDDDDSKVN